MHSSAMLIVGLLLASILLLLHESNGLLIASPSGLNNIEKQYILNWHNQIRAQVANGSVSKQPAAVYMPPLLWSDELATTAQGWADKCNQTNAHDDEKDRLANTGFASAGQNVQQCYQSQTNCIDIGMYNFFEEYKQFDYDTNACQGGQCGHYTQLIWAKSRFVGCGYRNNCPNNAIGKVVCNYGPGGNFIGEKPYESGSAGSKCPSHSPYLKSGGLCVDRKSGQTDPNSVCSVSSSTCTSNGGTFVSGQCECKCAGTAALANCQQPCTNVMPDWKCAMYQSGGYCTGVYENLMRTNCPVTCNLCEPGGTTYSYNQNFVLSTVLS